MSKPKWKFRKLGGNHTLKYLDEDAGKPNGQGTEQCQPETGVIHGMVETRPSWGSGDTALTN